MERALLFIALCVSAMLGCASTPPTVASRVNVERATIEMCTPASADYLIVRARGEPDRAFERIQYECPDFVQGMEGVALTELTGVTRSADEICSTFPAPDNGPVPDVIRLIPGGGERPVIYTGVGSSKTLLYLLRHNPCREQDPDEEEAKRALLAD